MIKIRSPKGSAEHVFTSDPVQKLDGLALRITYRYRPIDTLEQADIARGLGIKDLNTDGPGSIVFLHKLAHAAFESATTVQSVDGEQVEIEGDPATELFRMVPGFVQDVANNGMEAGTRIEVLRGESKPAAG